jgi:hypothetical protein
VLHAHPDSVNDAGFIGFVVGFRGSAPLKAHYVYDPDPGLTYSQRLCSVEAIDPTNDEYDYDTLKKFVDVMDKKATRAFNVLESLDDQMQSDQRLAGAIFSIPDGCLAAQADKAQQWLLF